MWVDETVWSSTLPICSYDAAKIILCAVCIHNSKHECMILYTVSSKSAFLYFSLLSYQWCMLTCDLRLCVCTAFNLLTKNRSCNVQYDCHTCCDACSAIMHVATVATYLSTKNSISWCFAERKFFEEVELRVTADLHSWSDYQIQTKFHQCSFECVPFNKYNCLVKSLFEHVDNDTCLAIPYLRSLHLSTASVCTYIVLNIKYVIMMWYPLRNPETINKMTRRRQHIILRFTPPPP